MPRRPPPQAFLTYCAGYHQDVRAIYSGLEEIADTLLASLSEAQYGELALYIDKALAKYSDADLKGILNRSIRDWRFTSQEAREFFLAARAALERAA